VLRTISHQYGLEQRAHNIILPLVAASNDDWDGFYIQTGNPLSPLSKVQVREPFPFDLGFAMTVHKAQGRTIPRVIIDLRNHPFAICRMSYAAIFVAMSRVKNRNHIRLLEPKSVLHRKSHYEYLADLRPEQHIAPFLHGYKSFGSTWDYNKALTYSRRSGTNIK
jgi:Helicase